MVNSSSNDNILPEERPCGDCPIGEKPGFTPNDLCDEILALVMIAAEKLDIQDGEQKSFRKNVRMLLEERLELHFKNGDCLTANQMNILVNAHCAVKRKVKTLETRIEKLEKDAHSHPESTTAVSIRNPDSSANR
jgi:hypothetical protein